MILKFQVNSNAFGILIGSKLFLNVTKVAMHDTKGTLLFLICIFIKLIPNNIIIDLIKSLQKFVNDKLKKNG